ncbi:GntR family transcriptional regulator [Devosia aurantiaca]|uniref:GntR family transcriptional regulator n=1 Tax=Devosia aurantiaca TaxID=2714858 RepID=A0A6M1SUM7_9HYPH|nr:GntR family transcriptional regulator [Devosia aurantiaca]NGP18835.1 GntR family transcriptional regulator [Devosia aurantiaca]
MRVLQTRCTDGFRSRCHWITRGGEDRAAAIRDRLRDAIVDRRLAPGTKLNETEVGALFDVSRTVVRAALQALTYEGLLTSERNRGAFVASPTPDEARHVFDARRLIEPGLVAAAIKRLGPSEIAAFRARLEEEDHVLHQTGPMARRAEINASGDFHLLLARVAGNAIIQRFMEELLARSSLVIALYGRSGASSCGHGDHANILAALEQRDAERASQLLVSHLDHIEADLDLRTKGSLPLREALGGRAG